MKLLGVLEISRLVDVSARTCTKHLSPLPFEPGPGGKKLYDSAKAIRAVLGLNAVNADGEFVDQAEAQRLLTIARKDQIDLEMEVTRGARIPLETIRDVNERAHSNVAGMLKAHAGKLLTEEAIQDMLAELREIGEAIA